MTACEQTHDTQVPTDSFVMMSAHVYPSHCQRGQKRGVIQCFSMSSFVLKVDSPRGPMTHVARWGLFSDAHVARWGLLPGAQVKLPLYTNPAAEVGRCASNLGCRGCV